MKRVFSRRFRLRRKPISLLRAVLLALLCASISLCAAFFQCRSILCVFAESHALWMAGQIANETAIAVLAEQAENCANVLTVVYDDASAVSSVSANTVTVNRVRTAMVKSIMDALEQDTALSVAVPFGTLTGVHWLSGIGPMISFPLSYTATVTSEISSQLTGIAINQSRYCVLVCVHIYLHVVTPCGRSTVDTMMSYPMAETILLGEVPDNLTEVYGDDQSLTGQIFDYGTTY